MKSFSKWFNSGSPWIWLNASAVSVSLLMLLGLIGLIAYHGLSHFWVKDVYQFQYKEKNLITNIAGEINRKQNTDAEQLRNAGFEINNDELFSTQILMKIGNRDINGLDFKWILEQNIQQQEKPENIITVERIEWGNFYGYISGFKENNTKVNVSKDYFDYIKEKIQNTNQLHKRIKHIEDKKISSINYQLEKLRLKENKYRLNNQDIPKSINQKRDELQKQYQVFLMELNTLRNDIKKDSLILVDANQNSKEVLLADVIRIYQPNQLSILEKIGLYFLKIWGFLSEDPREANTEGGVFPAIFGTVVMVLLMTVFVTPLGVITAIYLHEYATQGWLTKLIRVAVNNLAGVPSVVYGVFGLGFFVYTLGGSIDALFFPESLPAPTFGTPGLLWASLTLALLTVPVVIVSTEEGLSRIPKSLREGSLALGTTQAETLRHLILPIASPAIITGLILATARAAGEVAPLMLVGVVKLAPTLAVDGNFPFFHLDRKFMHLGFHIYDVGFQSPNVEAARPLVYATALLLILIIILLNMAAIVIRNHLREKYKFLD